MVAHHTCGGCNLEAGDLIGTGTISAPDGVGSMLELTRGGREPVTLPSGETRRFLDDGDEVIFRAYREARRLCADRLRRVPGEDGRSCVGPRHPSFPRKRESRTAQISRCRVPAFAGTTGRATYRTNWSVNRSS